MLVVANMSIFLFCYFHFLLGKYFYIRKYLYCLQYVGQARLGEA